MILSDLCIKRPVFATVLSIGLVIVGLATLASLPVREYPYQPQPNVSVITQHPGASADVVENRITRMVENELAGLEGARRIRSASRDGQSQVTVQFAPDQDLDQAASEVSNRIARLLPSLPEGAQAPGVFKAGSGIQVVMWVNVMSDRHSTLALTDIVRRQLRDRLSVIDGVAKLRMVGAKGHAMRVWLDPAAMAARGVIANDVIRVLEAENIEHPAGRVVSREREFSLRTHTGLRTAEDFRSLVIRRGDDGTLVTLDDVADISVDAEGQRWSARADARPAISLGFEPMADANPLEISRNVRAALDEITPSLPDGVEVDIGYEQAEFARAALSSIGFALGYSLLLVVGVIWLFLRSLRATLVPAVTIPICIIAAFAALAAFSYSVNLLILLGLIVAIGLVVDDAIVVLENIYRRVEQGQPALLAATDGAREISFAVVATTAVLVAVFLPLSFLEGRVGRLFSEFGVAVSAAVVISSVVALSLIPMLCSRLFAGHRTAVQIESGPLTRLTAAYRRSLGVVVRHPAWMAVLAVLVSVGAFFLHQGLPDEYAPRVDRGIFRVYLQAPAGATFDYTNRYAQEMESILLDEEIEAEVDRVLVRVPGGPVGGPTNRGRATVRLSDRSERSRSAEDIARIVEERLDELPGALFWVVLPRGLGGGGETRPVRIALGGESYEELAQWAEQLVDASRAHPALTEPSSSFVARQPQWRVDIDRARAADLGVSLGSIGRTLEVMLGSRKVTAYTHRDRDYPVILQARARDRATPSDLGMIHVRSDSTDQLIPLSALVKVTETTVPGSYIRIDRRRTVTVSAGVAEGYTLGQALNAIESLAREQLPSRAHVGYDGASLRLRESGSGLRLLFAFALLAVFLVLAAQFESFRNPLVIMITVPLALSGALLGLRLAGSSLNVYSHLGLVVLIGLAAKNGVLIVEFTNQLRDAGRPFREAVMDAAAIRLRPILMTSLCTIAGALPLLLATGADAESRRPLGIVIVAGVAVATLLTLYVVPGLYVLIGRNTRSPGHVAQTIRRLRGTGNGAGAAPEPSCPDGTVRFANSD